MGHNKDSLKKKKCMRYLPVLCLMGCLTLLGGCGRTRENAQKQAEETEKEDVTYTVQREESSLAKWKSDLPEGKTEGVSAPAIRGLCVSMEGKPFFAVSYEPREYKNSFDCWAISVPYESMVSVDTEVMYDYFQMVADLELGRTENISRKQAGIEEGNRSIFVAYYEGQTEAGGQAQPDKGLLYQFGKEDGEGNYYVEAADQIWTVKKAAADELFALHPYDFVLKVVSIVSVETVSKVKIDTGEKEYVMEAEEGGFTFDGRAVDESVFYGLYTELMSIFIEKEIPEDGEGIGGEVLLRVTYQRNNKEAPQITQEYYVYDETYAVARVNETEFFLVSREAVEGLMGEIAGAF